MPDYGDILEFLAKNPPQHEAERRLHASLLELLAQCLRAEDRITGEDDGSAPEVRDEPLEQAISRAHFERVHFN